MPVKSLAKIEGYFCTIFTAKKHVKNHKLPL